MPQTDLSAVLRPVAEAHGLPNAHYTSETVYNAEKEPLWFSTWAGICAEGEVPDPGDARPVDFLGVPLFVMRGSDGNVRVFQNICRHRGMILVSEPRKIEGAIRCPYHSWCYSHEGRLVATPHVGGPGQNAHPDIRKGELGLIEVRSHIWMGVIYINLDGSYSRLEDHYHIMEPGFAGQGTLVYRQIEGDDGQTFPDFAGLSAKWNEAGEYIIVAPNVMIGVQRDHMHVIILEPKGPRETVEHIHLLYASPDTSEALRLKNAAQWKVVFLEDVGVVEGMQTGRGAPGFDGGRFSPAMDGPTHHFHQWVARRMTGAPMAAE